MNEGEPDIQLPLTWIGPEEVPIQLVNQMICQFNQDEFILTFGQMAPPLLLGTDEQKLEQAEQIAYVAVKPLARLAMTQARVRELIAVLEANLANYEQYQQQIRGGDQGWPT